MTTERKNMPAEVFPPGDYLKDELEARDWSQAEFAEIIGRPVQVVSEIATGKRTITTDTAQAIGEAFGTSAEMWLRLQISYDLWNARAAVSGIVARRARLYEKAPVRDMVKRGWIEDSRNIEILEQQVMSFLEIRTLDEEPKFDCAARRSAEPNAAQLAWFYRARHLAKAAAVERKFTSTRLEWLFEQLKSCLLDPAHVCLVSGLLSKAGIRFIVIEGLPKSKIDGACFWLNASSPVIVLSMRYKRIDYFWHTLMHELGHVRAGHRQPIIDVDLDSQPGAKASETTEREVDEFASNALIESRTLDAWIRNTRPYFSKKEIIDLACLLEIHPGIIVGQLQHRGEIPYSHSRKMLVPVLKHLAGQTILDGWGVSFSQ